MLTFITFILSLGVQCIAIFLVSLIIFYLHEDISFKFFYKQDLFKSIFLKLFYFIYCQFPLFYVFTMPLILCSIYEKEISIPKWYLYLVNILGGLNLILYFFGSYFRMFIITIKAHY
ncbi:MAG: hypothetical protein PHY80_05825 [Rickettsiales bacterium]|nr:hypothetical protein [Rickettsiales bacterium]